MTKILEIEDRLVVARGLGWGGGRRGGSGCDYTRATLGDPGGDGNVQYLTVVVET